MTAHAARPHHRQAAPPRGWPRESHRPDAVRRRPRLAAHAARQAAALAASARAHHPHRHVEGRGAARACTWCSRARRCRFRTASCRSATTSTRSARTVVRFVGDPVAAVIARDEATADDALELIDVEYEPLRDVRVARGQPRASRAAHSRLRRRGQHPQARRAASSATSTRRSPARITCSTTCSSSRATRTCRSNSTPASR